MLVVKGGAQNEKFISAAADAIETAICTYGNTLEISVYRQYMNWRKVL